MLYIVLILVLGALGLVVAALITAESLWAWASLGVSILAGILLVIDWWRRRRALKAEEAAAAETRSSDETDGDPDADDTADTDDDADAEESGDEAADEAGPAESTELIGASGELASEDLAAEESDDAGTAQAEPEDPDAEPAEEQASAEDVRTVSVLEDEVVVVDERPRYHLGECEWLAERETIPLPAREARELGFSPCGRCGPDGVLSRRSRQRAGA